jgi:hypothetical protein
MSKAARIRSTLVWQKLGKWRLNLILSISLHPRFPVVHWLLHKGTTTAEHFLQFVQKRSTPCGIHYDLLDRAKIHTAEKALVQKGLPTIKQALAKKGLQQDLLPNGYPEYQPIEQAFNFVSSYVKKKANTYAPLGTWQEGDLCKLIKRGDQSDRSQDG